MVALDISLPDVKGLPTPVGVFRVSCGNGMMILRILKSREEDSRIILMLLQQNSTQRCDVHGTARYHCISYEEAMSSLHDMM